MTTNIMGSSRVKILTLDQVVLSPEQIEEEKRKFEEQEKAEEARKKAEEEARYQQEQRAKEEAQKAEEARAEEQARARIPNQTSHQNSDIADRVIKILKRKKELNYIEYNIKKELNYIEYNIKKEDVYNIKQYSKIKSNILNYFPKSLEDYLDKKEKN